MLCLLLCLAAPEPSGPLTLTYWISVRDAVGTDALTRRFDQPLAVRREAETRDLEAMPTDGVDPELLDFIPKLVRYGRDKPKADAALYWYHGTWFAPLPPVVVESRKTKDALIVEASKLRDVLRKRHGVDFPPFEFPDW